jgi:hypothetical protein
MAAHADPEASASQYVSASENNAGQDRFTFSLSQGGDYWLWARARGLGWTKNSFSVKVDGAPDFVYEVSPTGDAWVYGWREVYPVNETWEPLALSAGPHTLIFKGREADARLDAILVTNDPSYRPVEETPTPGPLRLGLPLIRRR